MAFASSVMFLFAQENRLLGKGSLGGYVEQRNMPCRLLEGHPQRDYSVYLPASYGQDETRTYPVLYLMHGGGEAHYVWETAGQLATMADSLIAQGQMQEMIIICPEANKGYMMYFNSPSDNAPNAPKWAYEDHFFEELIPFVESHYRVRTNRFSRAIAGFSMGGGAATVYGVHHPERFCFVGDISGYQRRVHLEWLRNDPTGEWRQQVIEDNSPVRRLAEGNEAEVAAWRQVQWAIYVGDHDFTLPLNTELAQQLRQLSIPYSMNVWPGDHNWQFVRPALGEILKKVSLRFAGH